MLDSATQRINTIQRITIREPTALSSESRHPPFEQLAPGVYVNLPSFQFVKLL